MRPISALLVTMTLGTLTLAQMGGMGRGNCPMCGQQWDGRYHGRIGNIPGNLPKPTPNWLESLNNVYGLEVLSKAQYQQDYDSFQVRMPYTMIIPQEENHIEWIDSLYAAYGIEPPITKPKTTKSISIQDAYETGIKIENKAIPIYEYLVKNATDSTTASVLNTVLYQTRMHSMMFNHALRMGMGNRWNNEWDGNGCCR